MDAEALLAHLRAVARAYPEAYEEAPWGDLAAKVRRKVFAFYGVRDGRVGLTVKLPLSREEALERPDTTPTGYGLGRSGWVSARFETPEDADLALLHAWLEESYRAVAPKTLSKRVPDGGPEPVPPPPVPELPADAPLAIVVSDDPLRLQRSVLGLARKGFRAETGDTSALERLVDVPARLLVIDLGRQQALATEVAEAFSITHFDGVLVLSGIRDAKAEARTRDVLPSAAHYSRLPPGDPGLLDTAIALLSC